MASGPITSWQIDGEKWKLTDFIFLGSQITAMTTATKSKDACSLEEKLLHTNLDKKQRHHFADKVHIVKAMVFPILIKGYDGWIIKKAKHRRTDAFKLWSWRRLLRIPWTARRSNQLVLKEINPEYSLEGLTLKLKFQFWPLDAKS